MSSPPKEDPPSPFAILASYVVLGSIISFTAGREPGTLPENVLVELAPTVIALVGFLSCYEVFDCMGAGLSKVPQDAKAAADHSVSEYARKPLSEEAYVAQRAQTNQVEQMPVAIFGSLACAVYVSGTVAFILTSLWAVLRIQYAMTYRGTVGMKYSDAMKRIGRYTIPCYFLANSMTLAAAIHAARSLVGN